MDRSMDRSIATPLGAATARTIVALLRESGVARAAQSQSKRGHRQTTPTTTMTTTAKTTTTTTAAAAAATAAAAAAAAPTTTTAWTQTDDDADDALCVRGAAAFVGMGAEGDPTSGSNDRSIGGVPCKIQGDVVDPRQREQHRDKFTLGSDNCRKAWHDARQANKRLSYPRQALEPTTKISTFMFTRPPPPLTFDMLWRWFGDFAHHCYESFVPNGAIKQGMLPVGADSFSVLPGSMNSNGFFSDPLLNI